jgi:phage N-6-adenine-methyltransferase
MISNALFSSNTDEWATPQEFFDIINAEFRFTLDAAANDSNAKCERYLTDALNQPWDGVVWLNPPYSAAAQFIKKAYEASLTGAVVVCLIPSRTDTKYWHDYVMKAAEIRFVAGRLRFGGSKNSAPFPSALVIFRAHGGEVVIKSQQRSIK